VAEGATYATAARHLPSDAGLSSKNIREHWRRGHVPVESELVSRLVESAQAERIDVLELGIAQSVRSLAMASAIVDEVTRRLVAGELEPTLNDGLRAARLLMAFQTAALPGREAERQLRKSHEAINGVLALAKAHMPADDWSAVLRAMDADLVLSPFVPLPSSG